MFLDLDKKKNKDLVAFYLVNILGLRFVSRLSNLLKKKKKEKTL